GKLVLLWDDNRISIDGSTELAVSDDQLARFRACGWDVQAVDGHQPGELQGALARTRATATPSFIACRTTIAQGAPSKAGTAAAHGAPLGAKEIASARAALGWHAAPFEIPPEIAAAWRAVGERGAVPRRRWSEALAKLDAVARAEFERVTAGRLPEGWQQAVLAAKRAFVEQKPKVATRQASKLVIDHLAAAIPELIGGSADLTGSNATLGRAMAPIARGKFAGRYIHYGVREHAMVGAMNGMALHKGMIPYGGSFLIFTDYCRPAIRLAAMMRQRVILVMTHDSIGLGEDGPTHQPVEQLAALRAIPNLLVFRPADGVETAECWALALAEEQAPAVLSLTRQSVAPVRLVHSEENLSAKGAYVLAPAEGKERVTLIATGSEVEIALAARATLAADGIAAAVVSMPCWELFARAPAAYREEILAPGTLRIAIEAAGSFGWERHLGPDGIFIGMRGFGASAPSGDLYKHFGITAEAVVAAAKARL
ncbi:MAG: transketolase-like TK C-terminal-containing protein, partial [Alphaproteobacteria bacterium]